MMFTSDQEARILAAVALRNDTPEMVVRMVEEAGHAAEEYSTVTRDFIKAFPDLAARITPGDSILPALLVLIRQRYLGSS